MRNSVNSSTSSNSPILPPYLRLTIIEARNLSFFADKASNFQPFIVISTGKKSMYTEHKSAIDTVIWNSTFEVPIIEGDFLHISLMDNGDMDQETALSSIIIDFKCYTNWKLKEEDFWIKLWDNPRKTAKEAKRASTPYRIFTNQTIVKKPKSTRYPCLHINIRYVDREALRRFTIKFEFYTTVDTGIRRHTEYGGYITRGDGTTRPIQLRYSQVRNIRDALVEEFPSLRHLDFPNKSYLSWLFPGKCKLNSAILEERKERMENFINFLFRSYKYNTYLSELLSVFNE